MKMALKNDEFQPCFQPKIDAAKGKVIGLESLIRWIHPKKGLIPPNDFIPVAEESNLIIDTDTQMIRKSMQQVLAWQKEGINTGMLSVNISPRQFASKDFVKNLIDLIEDTHFNPKFLKVEILERQLVENTDKVSEILSQLREHGVSISVDDFGTGYSSLSYLKNFPITELKIDRSFIKDIPDDKKDVSIVRTIIALGKNLGFNLVAEGAETKEQVDFLVKEGCSNIQSYYFSKPLNTEDCKAFLKNDSLRV